jgi:hypothetical protein
MRTSLFAFSLLLAGLIGPGVHSQSLSDIRIGEDITAVSRLGSPPSARNQMGIATLSKWSFPDGNELSVTSVTATGKIVYIESDWGGQQAGTITDFPGFYYGRTTLVDIRKRFGNNGFSFKGREAVRGPGNSIVLFNSYEISDKDNVIVTFVTSISGKNISLAKKDPSTLANFAELNSIILGDARYLRNTWGANLVFDPEYSKIFWK